MERVLKDIPRTRCVVYLDDLLVHAKDFEQAIRNVREVFMAIRKAGLRLNPAKCNLLARQTQFLGHVVSERGVATDPAKVAVVKDWPPPSNIAELRSFLGLASYDRRFVKDFSSIAGPLHQLTNKGQRFEWSEYCTAAFQQLKAALVYAPVLEYSDPGQPFLLDTDASSMGVGAVLSQKGEAGERVLAYYSCTLSRPERNYCVTLRELLAVILAVRHFRSYLLGTRFVLRTDHASLTWMLNFRQPERQVARWLEILQEYDFEVQHRPGRQHANADALSRRPCLVDECKYCKRLEERDLGLAAVAAEPSGVGEAREPFTIEQLRQQQASDPVLGKVKGWLEARARPDWPAVSSQGPEVKLLHSQWNNLELHCGVIYRRWRAPGEGNDRLQLLVPRALRPEVLSCVHGAAGAGHFGNAKTVRRMRQRLYWPGCRQDAEVYVHCCDICTAQKGPSQRSQAPLQQYLVG
uniref:Gypsy retrotransposon integrase-like protein 1 n=1 Tax=Mastacembelus armatus TaxID=205130 RepID=A0A3Q3KZ30_9TELE